jgi:hypothetical protein
MTLKYHPEIFHFQILLALASVPLHTEKFCDDKNNGNEYCMSGCHAEKYAINHSCQFIRTKTIPKPKKSSDTNQQMQYSTQFIVVGVKQICEYGETLFS